MKPLKIVITTLKRLMLLSDAENLKSRSLGKHSRNLAVFLSKQLHFAVFLQLCFVNSVPTRTEFQPFLG